MLGAEPNERKISDGACLYRTRFGVTAENVTPNIHRGFPVTLAEANVRILLTGNVRSIPVNLHST